MASKQDSTKVMWRIEYRKDRKSAWKKRPGLFETREMARSIGVAMRYFGSDTPHGKPCGFGNTRIRRHVRGGGR